MSDLADERSGLRAFFAGRQDCRLIVFNDRMIGIQFEGDSLAYASCDQKGLAATIHMPEAASPEVAQAIAAYWEKSVLSHGACVVFIKGASEEALLASGYKPFSDFEEARYWESEIENDFPAHLKGFRLCKELHAGALEKIALLYKESFGALSEKLNGKAIRILRRSMFSFSFFTKSSQGKIQISSGENALFASLDGRRIEAGGARAAIETFLRNAAKIEADNLSPFMGSGFLKLTAPAAFSPSQQSAVFRELMMAANGDESAVEADCLQRLDRGETPLVFKGVSILKAMGFYFVASQTEAPTKHASFPEALRRMEALAEAELEKEKRALLAAMKTEAERLR